MPRVRTVVLCALASRVQHDPPVPRRLRCYQSVPLERVERSISSIISGVIADHALWLICTALHHADISLRRRALDVLFEMCNSTNAEEIVSELLAYMPVAESQLKEELVRSPGFALRREVKVCCCAGLIV